MSFSLFLMSFTTKLDLTKSAYAVTWQNSAGYWSAVGPIQATWTGYKKEDEALQKVEGRYRKGFNRVYYTNCGKFRVYRLGYNLTSYDIDAIKYVKKHKDYSCNYPK